MVELSPLELDVLPDILAVDACITGVVNDQQLWNEFVNNPIGYLQKFGIGARTVVDADHGTALFYSILGDTELVAELDRHFSNFDPSEALDEDQHRFFLRRGVLRENVQLDLHAIAFLLSDDGAIFEAVVNAVAKSLVRSGLTDSIPEPALVRRQFEQLVASVDGGPDEYPPPIAVAFVFVLVLAVVAASVAVQVQLYVSGIPRDTIGIEAAAREDIDDLIQLRTLTRLLQLSADLSIHAQAFAGSLRSE